MRSFKKKAALRKRPREVSQDKLLANEEMVSAIRNAVISSWNTDTGKFPISVDGNVISGDWQGRHYEIVVTSKEIYENPKCIMGEVVLVEIGDDLIPDRILFKEIIFDTPRLAAVYHSGVVFYSGEEDCLKVKVTERARSFTMFGGLFWKSPDFLEKVMKISGLKRGRPITKLPQQTVDWLLTLTQTQFVIEKESEDEDCDDEDWDEEDEVD